MRGVVLVSGRVRASDRLCKQVEFDYSDLITDLGVEATYSLWIARSGSVSGFCLGASHPLLAMYRGSQATW